MLEPDNLKFLLETQARLGKKGQGRGFYKKDIRDKAERRLKAQDKKIKKLKLREDLLQL